MSCQPRSQAGMTIVELLVVISVSAMLMTVVTGFALNFWGHTVTLSADQGTLVSRFNVSTYLNKMIGQGYGFVNQNDIPDNNTGKVDPAIASGKYWLPIHAVPSTISMGATGTITPLLYFRKPSIDTAKNIIVNGSVPYEDNYILYLDGSSKQLRARMLANPSAPGNATKTTCPPNVATTSCLADSVVSDEVSSIGLRYFSRSGNTINFTSITDPQTGNYIGPDYPSVEIVELTINYYHKAQFHNATNTTTQTIVRVALRN